MTQAATLRRPGVAARPAGRTVPAAPSRAVLRVTMLLLLLSAVSWRKGTYFSGGVDPVVAAKALLACLGLALALDTARRTSSWARLGGRTPTFALLYLVGTCLGAWTSGDAFASVVVATRVAILLVAMVLLVSSHGVEECLGALTTAMTTVGGVAAVTGLPSFLGDGRLSGGIPPLSPNEISMLFSIVLLVRLRRVVVGIATHLDWVLIGTLAATIWLTGSRTGIAMLAGAVFLMLVQTRLLSTGLFLGLVASVPVITYVVLGTGTVAAVFERGGAENLTTLSSRTIAWSAAVDFNATPWEKWLGHGLSTKQIPVPGQFWDTQILDSSWLSALVQGGYLALAVVALWCLTVVVAAVRSPREWRPLWLGLVAFLIGRSILESGLFDATSAFLTLVLVSAFTEPARRRATASS